MLCARESDGSEDGADAVDCERLPGPSARMAPHDRGTRRARILFPLGMKAVVVVWSLVLLLGFGGIGLAPSAVEAQQAAEVYRRYSGAVVKVEVLEATSGAPSSMGTAFFAAPSLLLTNYHVVRDLVFDPAAYRLNLLPADGVDLGKVRVVAVDPAHDVAVLRVDRVHAAPLRLTPDPVPKGETLFSLGHESDLHTSVVAGVFNGAVEGTAAPLMHFSGSLNPGMSGGPTLRAGGDVVGINVSTSGDQLSFLVPALEGQRLLEQAAGVDSVSTDRLREDAGRRLTDFQDAFFSSVLADGLGTTSMGGATLPTGSQDRFDCSANPHEITDKRYDLIEYRCETMDRVMVGPRGSYGLIYMEHMFMASTRLSVLAFQALQSQWYTEVMNWEAPANNDATTFRCRRRNIGVGVSAELLVVWCTRRHLSHPGLYDLFVRSAMRGRWKEGVVSTLRATPISFTNAVALTEQWLKGFAWTR